MERKSSPTTIPQQATLETMLSKGMQPSLKIRLLNLQVFVAKTYSEKTSSDPVAPVSRSAAIFVEGEETSSEDSEESEGESEEESVPGYVNLKFAEE